MRAIPQFSLLASSFTDVPLETRLRPRKTPRQARAAATRARILAAARDVFATHGYAAGTTNRIADAAPISVGSLYQYFPNKDAILIELVREHIAEGADEIAGAIATLDDSDAPALGDMIRRVIEALVAVHARDRRLHRVLFEESPRPASLLAELRDLEDAIVAQLAARLACHPPVRDPELSARITVATIESLVHRLVASDRPLDLDRFVDEATTLITSYLDC
jgi:AcrR family transcriptional regulator